jgi:hypothetical protein
MTGTQSFLTIGAMALLALISLRFNATLLENRTTEIENKVYLTAFSLADDLIEEIKQKAFDEQTVEWRAIPEDELTPIANFAPEVRDAGETENPSTWDDIDDYNGYVKQISTPHVENYSLMSSVDYVSATDQDEVSNVQTYFKRVTVRVGSPYLSHPVRLSFVFTLHSK